MGFTYFWPFCQTLLMSKVPYLKFCKFSSTTDEPHVYFVCTPISYFPRFKPQVNNLESQRLGENLAYPLCTLDLSKHENISTSTNENLADHPSDMDEHS